MFDFVFPKKKIKTRKLRTLICITFFLKKNILTISIKKHKKVSFVSSYRELQESDGSRNQDSWSLHSGLWT